MVYNEVGDSMEKMNIRLDDEEFTISTDNLKTIKDSFDYKVVTVDLMRTDTDYPYVDTYTAVLNHANMIEHEFDSGIKDVDLMGEYYITKTNRKIPYALYRYQRKILEFKEYEKINDHVIKVDDSYLFHLPYECRISYIFDKIGEFKHKKEGVKAAEAYIYFDDENYAMCYIDEEGYPVSRFYETVTGKYYDITGLQDLNSFLKRSEKELEARKKNKDYKVKSLSETIKKK